MCSLCVYYATRKLKESSLFYRSHESSLCVYSKGVEYLTKIKDFEMSVLYNPNKATVAGDAFKSYDYR